MDSRIREDNPSSSCPVRKHIFSGSIAGRDSSRIFHLAPTTVFNTGYFSLSPVFLVGQRVIVSWNGVTDVTASSTKPGDATAGHKFSVSKREPITLDEGAVKNPSLYRERALQFHPLVARFILMARATTLSRCSAFLTSHQFTSEALL